VNVFAAGATFLIDVSDPLAPTVAGSFREMGEFTYPHTFERLPNGNVLATFVAEAIRSNAMRAWDEGA
jgi:hypothetical protein